MKIITVEEHFAAPGADATSGMGAAGIDLAAKLQQSGLTQASAEHGLALDASRVANMDHNGIDMQVLSSPEARAGHTSQTNDHLARFTEANPGRFAGFASLPWAQPDAAAVELKRCVESLGFVGAFVTNRVEDEFLDAQRFNPVLRAAVDLAVPINIHPGLPPQAIRDLNYSGLSPVVSAMFSSAGYGWHVDTGTHALHLILSGTIDRYPGLQIILGHWGELIPYFLPRIEERMPPRVTGLKRRITDYFTSNFHISPSGIFDYRPLQLCIQMIGVERILYAVDYPIMGLSEARPFLENAPIPDSDKQKIGHENAERLFRL